MGAGELPALWAVVTGRVPLVTPALYPAFPSPSHFAVFGRGGFWMTAFTFLHKGLTTAFWCAEVVGVVLRGGLGTNRLTGAYTAD